MQNALDKALIDAVSRSRDTVCLLDSDLNLVYCNPAWDDFALANAGLEATGAKVQGLPIFNVIPSVLAPFYRDRFEQVARTGAPAAVDYECSSPQQYRLFRMQILPLRQTGGFEVVHSLRRERPHAQESVGPSNLYAGCEGLITMCCHCRRTRRAGELERWDWVPEYVRAMPPNTTHGLCRICYAYFYPQYYPFKEVDAEKDSAGGSGARP